MKVEAETIEELFKKSDDQESTMRFVDEFVQLAAPNLSRKLFKKPSITMIGYGEMPYPADKETGVWPVLCLAPQKGTTNLYVAGEKEGMPLLTWYSERLGKVSCGKSCLRIKKIEAVNLEELEAMVKDVEEWMVTQFGAE